MKKVLLLAALLVSGCTECIIGPCVTGVKDYGEAGKVQLRSEGLGDLPFTFENRPKWEAVAQKECDKYWPGTRAKFEQVAKSEAHVAWYSCL